MKGFKFAHSPYNPNFTPTPKVYIEDISSTCEDMANEARARQHYVKPKYRPLFKVTPIKKENNIKTIEKKKADLLARCEK
jgi:hypothetical protein